MKKRLRKSLVEENVCCKNGRSTSREKQSITEVSGAANITDSQKEEPNHDVHPKTRQNDRKQAVRRRDITHMHRKRSETVTSRLFTDGLEHQVAQKHTPVVFYDEDAQEIFYLMFFSQSHMDLSRKQEVMKKYYF